jgi:hypothetical protein
LIRLFQTDKQNAIFYSEYVSNQIAEGRKAIEATIIFSTYLSQFQSENFIEKLVEPFNLHNNKGDKNG